MNNDLPRHAADKVKRSLDDVHQLASDPGEMLRIALLASGVCIGQAVGILAGMLKCDGLNISEAEVKKQVLELLSIIVLNGPDAAWNALPPSPQENAAAAEGGQ